MGAGNSNHAIYVYNASPYVIEVNCDSDRIYDQQRSSKLAATLGNGGINVSASADNARNFMLYYTATSTGATTVYPGKNIYFTPNCSKNKTVYATIIQEQEGENKRNLCVNFPVKMDQGLIVGYDGGIHIAANTSSRHNIDTTTTMTTTRRDFWFDTNGVDHFRSHSAHVANGSVQTIWVKCDTNRKYVRHESDILSKHIEEGRANGPTETSYTDLYDFAKSRRFITAYPFIPPQRPNAEELDSVNIAVYQEQEDGFRKLYDDFPAESNESVIVGYDGVIRRAEKGKVWIDTDGKNHRKTRIGNDIDEGSSQETAAIDTAIVSTGLPAPSPL